MLSRVSLSLFLFSLVLCVVFSCKHDSESYQVVDGNFPPQVANIIISRCAVAGCHNQASYANASHLLLDSWDHMFNGDDFGAAVVPYWPQYSPLMAFVNTDPSRGPVSLPTMPYLGKVPLLTKDEYNTLYNWIANGAPDKNGNIPFASNPATRQKIYVSGNFGNIDLVAVIDAEKKVIMRYIKVGASDVVQENGHDLVASLDGANAYESFNSGTVIQKIDLLNDIPAGTSNLGMVGWALLCLDPHNSEILVTNWSSSGTNSIVGAKATTMALDPAHSFGNMLYPHGITANPTFDTFFVTASQGNCVYKCTDPIGIPYKISLDGAPVVENNDSDAKGKCQYPHAICMSPDYSEYFVTCQNTNDVRVIDAHSDKLETVILVGNTPQEIKISSDPSTPYLFVTCYRDSNAFVPKGCKGSVYVINYITHDVEKVIYGDFFEPHGLAVDNRNNQLFVFSINADGANPHPENGNTKAGWYSIIDIKTLTPVNTIRYYLPSNPYAGTARFAN